MLQYLHPRERRIDFVFVYLCTRGHGRRAASTKLLMISVHPQFVWSALCFLSSPFISPLPPFLAIQNKSIPREARRDTRQDVATSLVDSQAEASVETARCSVREKHVELQVCNSRPMRSMCHDDDGIYRFTLLYMNLAQWPIDRMQETSIAHCNLFISPQFQNTWSVRHYQIEKPN